MKKLIAFLLLLVWTPNLLNADELVDRSTFFEHVVGMPESEFQKDDFAKKNAISKDAAGVFYINNKSADKQFRAGNFTTHNIANLAAETNAITDALPKPGKGTFSVLEAVNPMANPTYYDRFDVGANQAKPENNDAVFQVASNFNGLELDAADDNMSNLGKYVNDKTQGPFASISAAPGLILRHYYAFYNPLTEPVDWQQSAILGRLWKNSDADKQINLLEGTDIPVKNSYVSFKLKKPELVNDFAKDKIKVMWHGNIQVTSGLMPAYSKLHTQLSNTKQFVNQVFTATVDFGNENAAYKNNPTATEIAQAILDAAYEGTLRSAVKYGKKKVFLTMIGGGVFQNRLKWITNALTKMEQFIVDSGLEVTLIIFDSTDWRIVKQMPEFREDMLTLAKQTGGTYTQYSPAHPEGQILTEKEEDEEPSDPILDALIKIKNPYEAIPFLRANNVRFASKEEALTFLQDKANFIPQRAKLIVEAIDDLIQPDDLKNALNNLASTLTGLAGELK